MDNAEAKALGELVGAVKALNEQLDTLKDQIASLETRLTALRDNANKGLGILIGIFAVLGLLFNEFITWAKHLVGINP